VARDYDSRARLAKIDAAHRAFTAKLDAADRHLDDLACRLAAERAALVDVLLKSGVITRSSAHAKPTWPQP
jgi:hypothetical protein